MINPDDMISRQATAKLQKLIDTVNGLVANDYFRILYSQKPVSNPPTLAEVNNEFGTPGDFNGIAVGFIEDTTNTRFWLCITNDSSTWFVTSLTRLV